MKYNMNKIWGFIYLFSINGKGYVGYTTNLKKRLNEHWNDKRTNRHFHNALRKYFSPLSFRIIESHYDKIDNLKEILPVRESFWIKELETYDPKQEKGWNLTNGGEGAIGYKHSEESIRKQSMARSGENGYWFGKVGPNKNKKVSEETRRKQSLAHSGRKHSEKTKQQMSNNHIGIKNPFYGKTHTDENKIKMGDASKRYWEKRRNQECSLCR
jgi:group I intron endonuclease